MSRAVEAAIQSRFPGSRVWQSGASVEAVLAVDDVHHSARLRLLPTTEIYVDLAAIDGFTLEARWRKPLFDGPARDSATVDELFTITSNDRALAEHWLDATSSSALRSADERYHVVISEEYAEDRIEERQRFWTMAIGDGVVALRKRGVEDDLDAAVRVLAGACRIAGFPWRWAGRWRAIGDALGGTVAERVELGGAPICTVDRGGARIEIGLCRRVVDDDDGRLRTWVRAHRVTRSNDQLELVAAGLPRDARPPTLSLPRAGSPISECALRASSASAALARLDVPALTLIESARPGAVMLGRDAVTVWYDGV